MEQRINVYAKNSTAINALHELGKTVSNSSIDPSLMELVYFRISQINGCVLCLDMHSRKLRAEGETEQRLYAIAAWREAPFYSGRERAALAWAEAVTNIQGSPIAQEIYVEARNHFSETELVDLTMGVVTINGYNRINIAFGVEVKAD